MPVVDITLVAGRTHAQLRSLVESVTTAVEQAIGAPRESVRVILHEVPATHFAVGGTPLADSPRYRSAGPRSSASGDAAPDRDGGSS